MIFENLNDIPTKFGSEYKPRCTHNKHRSNMMLNPLNLKHLNRIDSSDADVITLNLEDAIAPSRKKEALRNIAIFLSHLKHSDNFIIIRVNPLELGGIQEIEYLNSFGFDAIRVAKIKNQTQIAQALSILADDKELHISLETKEAFDNLSSLRIDERFTTVNLGILDLLSSMSLPQSLVKLDNPTIEYILSKFLIDSHIASLHPVSFMFQEYNDTDTFRQWCHKEKQMGFTSKACMGPKQVAIANEVFGYTPEQLARARYIKEIFEANSAKGINGFMDERYDIFVDEPIYKDALVVLGEKI
jgi:citrate lyase subunit beta/citryl-CoA lyase